MSKNQRIGEYIKCSVAGEYYLPMFLKNYPRYLRLIWKGLYTLTDKASIALGRLDGMSKILPEPSLFLYRYVRKEAVLSSQIEGTQSSLSDLLLYENEEAPGAQKKCIN